MNAAELNATTGALVPEGLPPRAVQRRGPVRPLHGRDRARGRL